MRSDAAMDVRFDDVRNGHVLAALSGGADSVALLVLLCRQRSELNLRITAAHLHHGIRGADADADAAWCEALCRRLGVELILQRIDVPTLARKRKQGLETAAREARYGFLREAQRQCGADVIALAHHRDDQAETILMHLLRGAGPEGVCGMARLKDGLYRPLLDVPRQALRQFLENAGIDWREDATNAVADNPRNALRLNVLPEIVKSYPTATEAIARYGQLARAESELLTRLTDDFLKEKMETGPWGARLRLDGSEEEALLRRAVRRISAASLDMEKTDAIVALAKRSRGKLEVSGALRVEKTPGALYFLPSGREKPAEAKLNVPGETVLDGVCRIVAEAGIFPIDPGDPFTEVLDAEALEGTVVRTRVSGDRIHPLGAPGERLLSDYLTDHKIDRPLRQWLPLVACGGRVLWVCGVGISQHARLKSDTARMVRLKIYFTDEKAEVHYEE